MTGRALTAAILCLALRAGGEASAQEPRIFEGPGAWKHPESRKPTEQELLFNDRNAGGFQSRSFYFTAYLDDEVHVEISLFRWGYGLLGGWGLQVVTAESGGTPFVFEERISDREITTAQDRFHIRFGDNLLQGRGGDYDVSLRLREFGCDLRFKGQVPPWMPGDGYAYLDPQRNVYIRYGVPAPLARVEGFLTLAGRTRAVRGWGYADRGLIAAPISRMSSPTYAFRAFGAARGGEPGCIVSLLRYESHPAYGPVVIPVLLYVEGKRWVIASREVSFTAGDWVEDPELSVPYPRRLAVRVVGTALGTPEGGTVRLEGAFVGASVYHYSDVFEKIPGVFRALVDVFFDRPIIFRLLGSFHGTVSFPDGTERALYLRGHGEYTVID